MAKKYLDLDGLSHFWQAIKNAFVADITYNSTSKKIQKTKAGSTSDVVTLSTVATSGSYSDLSNKPTIPTLKNVFGKVKVGSTTIEADTTQDTLELVAGSNVTLTPDSTNDKVTIAATDTTYSAGTNITITGTTIATTAEVNQNAFSNVKVGSTTVAADAKTDTLELIGDSNGITITPDATNDKITFTLSLDAAPTASSSKAATSGSIYNALSNKANLSDLATVATSGSYNDLNDTPTIPTLKNVFGKVKVGSTTVEADTTQDTLELAGSNVTLTPDATNDKVTIGITASNVTTALGNTAVARATGDASGNSISGTYAPKASPALTGTPTAPTATAGTNTTQIATTAFVKTAVETAITGAAAFQGAAPTTFAPTNYKAGYYWVISTGGTYAGEVCEPGDMIFAVSDYASAYTATDFDVIQTNLDITSITNAEIDNVVAA